MDDINQKPSNPKDIVGTDKLPMGHGALDVLTAYASLGVLEGTLKYGLANYREVGIRVSIYLDAMERHISKFANGEWADPKTRVPHLASAAACIAIILDADLAGKIVDDRPKPNGVSRLVDELSETVRHLRHLFAKENPKHYTIGSKNQNENYTGRLVRDTPEPLETGPSSGQIPTDVGMLLRDIAESQKNKTVPNTGGAAMKMPTMWKGKSNSYNEDPNV